MKTLYFEDLEILAYSVADTYDSLKCEDFEGISIISKYEEARQIIKELLCIGYDIHSIDIHDYDWDGYDAEYIISLYDDEIWCEPMLRETGYLTDDSHVIYVLDNCSSKVIPYCKGKTVYEVTVGEYEFDCDECECACQKDEKPITPTELHKKYTVNGKPATKEEFDKEYEKFEQKYMDNVKDILLRYNYFMDDMNEFRKRFFKW